MLSCYCSGSDEDCGPWQLPVLSRFRAGMFAGLITSWRVLLLSMHLERPLVVWSGALKLDYPTRAEGCNIHPGCFKLLRLPPYVPSCEPCTGSSFCLLVLQAFVLQQGDFLQGLFLRLHQVFLFGLLVRFWARAEPNSLSLKYSLGLFLTPLWIPVAGFLCYVWQKPLSLSQDLCHHCLASWIFQQLQVKIWSVCALTNRHYCLLHIGGSSPLPACGGGFLHHPKILLWRSYDSEDEDHLHGWTRYIFWEFFQTWTCDLRDMFCLNGYCPRYKQGE